MKYNFTIITVVKNDKNGIIKTIRSVMSQNFKDFEYIVVDGNSSDGTLFKIRNLRKDKKNFKFIKRNDVSYYDSLNYAIGKSKGKFIASEHSKWVLSRKCLSQGRIACCWHWLSLNL